jgi:hypothetical protein
MGKPRQRTVLVPAFFICVGAGLTSPSLAAEPPDSGLRDADRHFERGVALYTEADYRGALIEFMRAYTLAPNGVVLFNIGETQYQLRDYAAALATFQQYLVEVPDDSHRALAVRNIKELRGRVGELRVVTIPPGATISINDRVVGQAPLEKPVIVGIGHLDVRAVLPGRPPVQHPIEIAAEDEVLATMEIPPAPAAIGASTPRGTNLDDRSSDGVLSRPSSRTAGWVATGILAGGAVAFGVLALNASSELRDARTEFPTTSERLDQLSSRTRTLSIAADSFAAAALLVGGITLYATIDSNRQASRAQLTAGLGTVRFDARF